MPGFKTPHWVRGAVMYQIFVDRFYDGDKTNNVLDNDEYSYIGEHVTVRWTDWNRYPAQDGIRVISMVETCRAYGTSLIICRT